MSILERTEAFLDEFERHLSVKGEKAREIVDEVRGDLLAHVSRFREQGSNESDAVDLALQRMGDPKAAAREISQTVPPLATGFLKPLRYFLAGGIIIWTVMILWSIRAWTYGANPTDLMASFAIMAIHLVPVIFLWPTLIWRQNWLFGLIPVGVGVVMILVLSMGGTKSESSLASVTVTESPRVIEGPPPVASLEAPVQAGYQPNPISTGAFTFLVISIALLIYQVSFLQRRRQRRVVVGLVLGVFGVIQGIFLLEENAFRKERDDWLTERKQAIANPDSAEGDTAASGANLLWDRPLSPGNAIGFDSRTGRIWVND